MSKCKKSTHFTPTTYKEPVNSLTEGRIFGSANELVF